MPEDCRQYYNYLGDLKKQNKSYKDDIFVKEAFINAYNLGKKVGFNEGYDTVVGKSGSFEFDTDNDLLNEDMSTVSDGENFDSVDELLNY